MKRAFNVVANAALGLVFMAGTAQAHYLWIEPHDAEARLYYGEADVLFKEKSPGKLDNIKAPRAFVQGAADGGKPGVAAISRATEYFGIAGTKGAAAILAVEESLEVRDLTRYGLGVAKSNYYARFGQPGTEADHGSSPLVLDVQENMPGKLTVLYRGQPVKDAKLEVIAQNTWVQEHKTDARGTVEINTPWRGQYDVDRTPGEFAGKAYESLRNHFTYTFFKTEGADPGPAMPPRHGTD